MHAGIAHCVLSGRTGNAIHSGHLAGAVLDVDLIEGVLAAEAFAVGAIVLSAIGGDVDADVVEHPLSLVASKLLHALTVYHLVFLGVRTGKAFASEEVEITAQRVDIQTLIGVFSGWTFRIVSAFSLGV